jgi:acyl carrier protein
MKKILTSPYDLVAGVLEIDKEELTSNKIAGMGETSNWDSLKQVMIINALEENYDMKIPNEDIEKYTTMEAIIGIYEKQTGTGGLGKRLKERFKRSLIGKIFFKQ